MSKKFSAPLKKWVKNSQEYWKSEWKFSSSSSSSSSQFSSSQWMSGARGSSVAGSCQVRFPNPLATGGHSWQLGNLTRLRGDANIIFLARLAAPKLYTLPPTLSLSLHPAQSPGARLLLGDSLQQGNPGPRCRGHSSLLERRVKVFPFLERRKHDAITQGYPGARIQVHLESYPSEMGHFLGMKLIVQIDDLCYRYLYFVLTVDHLYFTSQICTIVI